jgi:hypothetical protein
MSVPTDATICFGSYAETALKEDLSGGIMHRCDDMGYVGDSILRHEGPEELFAHIRMALSKMDGAGQPQPAAVN